MGGPIYDCLNNPLAAVRTLFENATRQAASPKDLGRGDWGVKELFDNWIAREGNLERIPELNSVQLQLLAPGSLVRYRGMVQDMLNMEYYMGAYRGGNSDSWRTCKYTDVGDMADDKAAETQIWDRKLLYCVPVPGESWVRESKGAAAPFLAPPAEAPLRQKREREEECDMVGREADCHFQGSVDPVSSLPHADCQLAVGRMQAVDGEEEGPGGEERKRQSELHPCLVKVYDSGAESELKLNDVVEFVGVLAVDPVLAGGGLGDGDGEGDMMAEMDVNAILPPSRVPRLHCITMRSLSGKPRLEGQLSNEVHEGVRSSLLSRLAALLGGDRLGGEALLLHMLARVHLRSEPLAIGKLALNLFGCSASEPSLPGGIAAAMGLLLPRAHRVGLSLPTLNAAPFAPRKDYAADRLVTGVLQLAEGTHLTLDETELESGQLSAIGVRNVESLKTLIEWQKVEYDFEYYKVDMAADISVLVLSDARSRLLPADMAINIKPINAPMLMSADEPELSMWRQYLSAARHMEHSVPAGVQKVLEHDLVDARKEDRSLGPETFHRWLTLARLESLSYGERELREERWREVRQFERLCEARLRVDF